MDSDGAVPAGAGGGGEELRTKAEADLGWAEICAQLAALCHTEVGAAAARALGPCPTRGEAERWLDLAREALELHRHDTPPPFGEIVDLEPALQRLHKEGTLAAPTLIAAATTLRAIADLARYFASRAERAPGLAQLAGQIDPLVDVWGAIADCFEPDGSLADHASGALRGLRRRVLDLRRRVTSKIKQLLESPQIAKHLQDSYFTQRETRYVLPVRADAGSAVPGIVLGSSASGATIFVEPTQVVELDNQLKVAQLAVQREEARILAQLSALVAEEQTAIRADLRLAHELDLIDARARLALRMDGERPRVGDHGRLELRRLRHPLMALGASEVIPNDIELPAGCALLITGPNAGGKTVCLKAAGLAALMVRSGLLPPVTAESRVPFYRRVLTDIGDAQSLERNLSTFSAHIAQLTAVLQHADESSLVLIDEIATATDPGEGEALARALLEAVVERAAQLVVTTHYEGLKALPLTDQRFRNAAVGFDLEAIRPTFALHHGTPGSSFALAVARRLGVPPAIADRAEELLGSDESQLAQLLTELARERTSLAAQQKEAAVAAADARELQRRLDERLRRLRAAGERAVAQTHQQTLEELKSARATIRGVQRDLRAARSRSAVKRAESRLSEAARVLRAHDAVPLAAVPARAEQLTPGTPVVVPKLGGEAEVIEAPRRGEVLVLRGGKRTRVAVSEVTLTGRAPRGGRPASSAPQEPAPAAGPSGRTVDNTADLRGMRVDDALRAVDALIDEALPAGREQLYILHGHGTGALRRAVRAHVADSPLVERVRAGDPEEGADAVTVIYLR